MSASSSEFKSGVIATASAFLCWGLFPLFWKLLDGISSVELIAHRIVWCTVFVIGYLVITQGTQFWRGIEWRVIRNLALSAALIAINWWVFIWAIGNDKVVESSLGYFINPLVSVVFGVVFLRERLNPTQWSAVAIAASGVLYLTLHSGVPPWIALALALSFGSYGLVRKIIAIDALRGLAIEGVWLLAPALLYLALLEHNSFGSMGTKTNLLLICTGPITAIPLLLFAYGARRIPLSLVGILQYIGPTLQFAAGVWLYKEPFSQAQLLGFGLTWLALIIYTGDSWVRYARARRG